MIRRSFACREQRMNPRLFAVRSLVSCTSRFGFTNSMAKNMQLSHDEMAVIADVDAAATDDWIGLLDIVAALRDHGMVERSTDAGVDHLVLHYALLLLRSGRYIAISPRSGAPAGREVAAGSNEDVIDRLRRAITSRGIESSWYELLFERTGSQAQKFQ